MYPINFEDTNSNRVHALASGTSSLRIQTFGNDAITLEPANSEAVRVENDGRVKVGKPVGTNMVNRKMTVREDATDGTMRGMKIQNWGASNAISGIMFQSYDFITGWYLAWS